MYRTSGKTHSKEHEGPRRREGPTPFFSGPITVHPESSLDTSLLVLDLEKSKQNKLKTHTGFIKAYESFLFRRGSRQSLESGMLVWIVYLFVY